MAFSEPQGPPLLMLGTPKAVRHERGAPMPSVTALDIVNLDPLGATDPAGVAQNAAFDAKAGYLGAVLAVGDVPRFVQLRGGGSVSTAARYLVSAANHYARAWAQISGVSPFLGIGFNNTNASATAGRQAADIVLQWLDSGLAANVSPLGPFLDYELGEGFSDFQHTMDMLDAYLKTNPASPNFYGSGNWTCAQNKVLFDKFGAAFMYPQIYCVRENAENWLGSCGGVPAGATVTSSFRGAGCTISTAQQGIDVYRSVFGTCPTMVLVYHGSQGIPQVWARDLTCPR
jgi:hypothetical protein